MQREASRSSSYQQHHINGEPHFEADALNSTSEENDDSENVGGGGGDGNDGVGDDRKTILVGAVCQSKLNTPSFLLLEAK